MRQRNSVEAVILRRTWGQAVAQRRRRLGLSQRQLASSCAVTQQTISKIERGLMVPLDHLKVRLARGLGTTPQQLFSWPVGEPVVPWRPSGGPPGAVGC